MKDKNFPSKGINVKKANVMLFITNKKNKKEKEDLMKLNFFKDLKMFKEIIKDEKENFKYTKNYFISCKKENNFEELLNVDEDDESKSFKLFLPDKYKHVFLSKFNPEKPDD